MYLFLTLVSEIITNMRIPGYTVVKNLLANAGGTRDVGSVPGWGRTPGVGNGKPALVFLPGKISGQRSLADYSPWSHKELDMTECACVHRHTHTHTHASCFIL